MIMVTDSAKELKRFPVLTSLSDFARLMVLRMMLAFTLHRGRMSCPQAGGAIRTEPVHRGQITRFLARPRWQKDDFNFHALLRLALLQLERVKGKFLDIIDATLCGQSGKNKHARKSCHSFTFGLLITPSGYRLPFQIPHYTKESCEQKGIAPSNSRDAASAARRNVGGANNGCMVSAKPSANRPRGAN